MVKSIFDELDKKTPRRHFTIGIVDDVTHTSLAWDPSFRTEAAEVSTSLFYGLGADGTVGANKNSIKIIGHETDRYVQGLLRLRFKEVWGDHGLAPAIEPATHSLRLPGGPRKFRSLPSV